jgi:hypothetical protein
LLLDSLNLDDDSILDDHADFSEAEACYGSPNMIQVQVAGGRGVDGSSIIETGKSLFRHAILTPLRCIEGEPATTHMNRCVAHVTSGNVAPIFPIPKSFVKTNIDKVDQINEEYEFLSVKGVEGTRPVARWEPRIRGRLFPLSVARTVQFQCRARS